MLVLAVVGVMIIIFVAATGGAYGAWMLWIAIPLLMLSLGYFYLVSALVNVWGMGESRETEGQKEEEKRRE